jgi:signal peptidase I
MPGSASPAPPETADYPYVEQAASMETTIHPGETVTARPVANYGGSRGDIVVVERPAGWSAEVEGPQPSVIKRVIAVAGETVQCCDSRNRVMVNGAPLDEPYVYYLPAAGAPRQDRFGPVTIPAGMIWLMGDSRNNSADSRVPGYGPVATQAVRAIVDPHATAAPPSPAGRSPATTEGSAERNQPGLVPVAIGRIASIMTAGGQTAVVFRVDNIASGRSCLASGPSVAPANGQYLEISLFIEATSVFDTSQHFFADGWAIVTRDGVQHSAVTEQSVACSPPGHDALSHLTPNKPVQVGLLLDAPVNLNGAVLTLHSPADGGWEWEIP